MSLGFRVEGWDSGHSVCEGFGSGGSEGFLRVPYFHTFKP